MEIYFAPMEGITDEIFRSAYKKYYGKIDKYFTPFLSPSSIHDFTKRDMRLIGEDKVSLIPQILSNNSKETINMINELQKLGIEEVNLNFGCPSLTVTKKNKGAGIFNDLDHLDSYLKDVFDNVKIKVSIKSRLGIKSIDEFEKIIEIYNKYPIEELIIHPRLGIEFYNGTVHLDIFEKLIKSTRFNVIYNGDIKNIDDIKRINDRFPTANKFMIGRGLLENPSMFINDLEEDELKNKFLLFYLEIFNKHYELIGSNSTLFYMKELWFYFKEYFIDSKRKYLNLIKIKDFNEFKNYTINIIKNSKLNIR